MNDQLPNPLLSVIVPAYNRADDLATLLGSLESQRHRLDIVVVDDCSPNPAVYNELKTRHPHVRFIRQATNRGPAAARNRGAREANCELIFFMDSDTAVVEGTIDTILRVYREHPNFVVCCGTCDKRPINDGLFAHYKALLEASWIDDRRGRITYIRHVGSRAFTIKRTVMLELGGFNETLPTPDVEDYEFGYRLHQAHGPIPFCAEIQVRHRYDTLWTQARLYFRRVIMWWGLRDMSKGADAVGSTSKEAAVAVVSSLATVSLAAGLLVPLMWWVALSLAAAAIVLNHRFLASCLRERGPLFAVAAFCIHTFLSWFICGGAGVAVVRSSIGKIGWSAPRPPKSQVLETGDVV
ncbi:MAG: glycosyltransferase family 2 protein [Planctomycetes bacterium]|nr:glycosyltransferase family 2 protein [Planctomycetota bacterium]